MLPEEPFNPLNLPPGIPLKPSTVKLPDDTHVKAGKELFLNRFPGHPLINNLLPLERGPMPRWDSLVLCYLIKEDGINHDLAKYLDPKVFGAITNTIKVTGMILTALFCLANQKEGE